MRKRSLVKTMSQTKKTRSVIFRVTEDEWQRLEHAAGRLGQEVNEWSRQATLTQSSEPTAMSPAERLIYEEVARVRYLMGHAFGLLSQRQLSVEAWEKIKKTADEKPAQIAAALLARLR